MTIEQQVKDWKKLKELSLNLRNVTGDDRKKVLDELYSGVKKYWETYRTKFDYCKKPR